jgi:hypothetical protein
MLAVHFDICIDVGVCENESESSVFQNSAFGEALLNGVPIINVLGGKFKFSDFDTDSTCNHCR